MLRKRLFLQLICEPEAKPIVYLANFDRSDIQSRFNGGLTLG